MEIGGERERRREREGGREKRTGGDRVEIVGGEREGGEEEDRI